MLSVQREGTQDRDTNTVVNFAIYNCTYIRSPGLSNFADLLYAQKKLKKQTESKGNTKALYGLWVYHRRISQNTQTQ